MRGHTPSSPSARPRSPSTADMHFTHGVSQSSVTTDTSSADLVAELSRCIQEFRDLLSSLRSQQLTPVLDCSGSQDVDVQSNNSRTAVACNKTKTTIRRTQRTPGDQHSKHSQQDSVSPASRRCPNRTYELRLAQLTILCSATDIPDPPALSFARDIAWLDRIWDDRSHQWDNSSPLRIRGHSIALVYWPSVYRYQGTKQWAGIKQRWFEWKVRWLPSAHLQIVQVSS